MKAIRLTTIFLMMIFFISLFSSSGYAVGPTDTKDPIKAGISNIVFHFDAYGSPIAHGLVYLQNTSKYEVHNIHATIDLYNKKGQKISISPVKFEDDDLLPGASLTPGDTSSGVGMSFALVPSISNQVDLEGAYVKPTYTFVIGKKAAPVAKVKPQIIAAYYKGSTFHLDTIIVNYGEATATNFHWKDWTGYVVWPDESHLLDLPQKKHPNINQSLVLGPGQYVRASFEISNVDPSIPIPDPNDLGIELPLQYDSVAPFQDSQFLLMVNNQRVSTQALIENGITYVPIRALSEALGAEISWDEPSQSVTVTKDKSTLRLFVDSNRYYLNDQIMTSPGKARLQNNTTFMVPLRIVAEAFHCMVHYEQNWEKELIIIISK
ncbi:copper amine oxidase N-terminal domain-containing protein [Brevibacillus sp. SYP-B805]|uniref:copper amine oxidase N-terminal domain-containing protein n=1 Tax=Brevibacillus sp. SYP-B805 TaxID=1578199 RepID=UPI0013EDC5B7|nr:copper amine oxidase N-terminal domain-containing protein [Brevibacillus sp. SYP-B805]NGQ97003.1 copper amine oxidase N-terminal domain-containing protein [Brevibacillus sp. SYP-B805]